MLLDFDPGLSDSLLNLPPEPMPAGFKIIWSAILLATVVAAVIYRVREGRNWWPPTPPRT